MALAASAAFGSSQAPPAAAAALEHHQVQRLNACSGSSSSGSGVGPTDAVVLPCAAHLAPTAAHPAVFLLTLPPAPSVLASPDTAASTSAPASPASPAAPKPRFEPRADPAVLGSQLVVLGATVGAGAYWWYVVVPSERASLARSKRRGSVREYLQELNQDDSR